MSGRVIVVGSVNVDLVVRGERLPEPGETVGGGTFARFHGGKGGNKAVAAARLGASVALVAALGADDFGDDAATSSSPTTRSRRRPRERRFGWVAPAAP